MDVKFVTLESEPELVGQYITMRAELTSKSGHAGLPAARIRGDDNATFALAVENGTVRAGLRLSTPDQEHDGWLPVDKVPGATLESLFLNHQDMATKMRRNEDGYKPLYIDGIFANMGVTEGRKAMRTMTDLLNKVGEYARSHSCDMVYCFPHSHNARAVERHFKKQEVPYVDLGPQPYIGHDGSERGSDRSLVLFFLNPQLQPYVRGQEPQQPDAPARRTWRERLPLGRRKPVQAQEIGVALQEEISPQPPADRTWLGKFFRRRTDSAREVG